MTIDKAIEILTARTQLANLDTKGAMELGIEALKRIQRRRADLLIEIKPLPGETKS